MRLSKIHVKGFRSLQDVEIVFDNFTVLIGENDAGKSSVLDLLDIVLNGDKRPDGKDFYRDLSDNAVKSIEVILEFSLDKNDKAASQYAMSDLLKIKKFYYTTGSTETYYMGQISKDSLLNQDFSKLSTEEQKTLIRKLDETVTIIELSNKERRLEWLNKKAQSSEKVEDWIPAPSRWGVILPRFERYGSMDYSAPESMVLKTLKQVFEQVIYEDLIEHRPIESLRKVQEIADEQIQIKISELLKFIQKYDKRVRQIRYEPIIDFTNSIKPGEFKVDTGRGLHFLSKTGSGTKRRMFMATLEWDREVTSEQKNQESQSLPTIIRGYDEPDTNLHYEAQRSMFQAIQNVINFENSRIQAVLCTHSLIMIDRSPTKSIRLLLLNLNGQTEISQIKTDNDAEIDGFLTNLARELGITNSLIFYEKCYVLVEGETEENALPLLYKTLYQRSLFEDGIRVINMKGNGAVKEFLKLLSKNRKESTLIFIDTDSKSESSDSPARLAEKELKEAGFDEEFIKEHLILVGEKEFEDSFSNKTIVECLNKCWPKRDGSWCVEDIQLLRQKRKFLDELAKKVFAESSKGYKKPEFGKGIGEVCKACDVPEAIVSMFKLARKMSRI